MKRNCTIQVAKTKALIGFAVTAKLMCAFVFAWAKMRFSHGAAVMEAYIKKINVKYNKVSQFYHEKVQVGKDQEKAQSEKDSHSKNRGGKKTKLTIRYFIP